MEGAEPRCRREISPVAGVFVAVCRTASLLAKASGLGGRAEEGRQKSNFGQRRIWSRVAVRSERDAVLGVGADDSGLEIIKLVSGIGSNDRDTYNLRLLACQHSFSVVGEDDLFVNHRGETNARLLCAFCVFGDEVVDLQRVHASHTF